ncbi:MAG TPA: lasso RiPP family leader peptide-containing protein [Pseudonocardiaceae bacterium]|nr:lasso RiPP family leader peptide-containing protein [Pseudonocardiaceae bacterium]
MRDEQADPESAGPIPGTDYEPPMLIDFGTVFEKTEGSSGGSSDDSGQRN